MMVRRDNGAARWSVWRAGVIALCVMTAWVSRAGAEENGAPAFSMGGKAAWVESVEFTPALLQQPDARGAVSDGVRYLLIEDQILLGPTNTHYRHYVMQFITEAGVNQQSTVQVQYDPSYQRLEFHRLGLWRGGEWMDQMRPGIFRSMQREQSLEWRMLDGRTSVVAVPEDVRVGDALEVAYTIHGDNPVFEGRYVDSFLMGWWVPVDRQRLRVLIPAGRALRWWSYSNAPAPSEREAGGLRELRWDLRDLPPIQADGDTPVWYRAFPEIGLGEFATWADVAAWSVNLYPDTPLPKDLAPRIEDWRGLATEEERLQAALDFVQNEIRYFGLELGVGTHRANPPALVLLRRFGDCKDKAALLCALLKALDIDARPALVHTALRHKLKDEAPSPLAFNHVIVCVNRGAGRVWVDPTRIHQRGRAEDRHLPPYGYALVVAPDSRDLTTVEQPGTETPGIDLRERFDMPSFDEAAALTVVTRFSGHNAEEMRARLADTTRPVIEKEYLNYYAQRYPDIAAGGDLEVTDCPVTNILTVTEHYRIENLWTADVAGGAGSIQCELKAQEVSARALKPATVLRSMPLGVPFPFHIRQTIEVHLPEEWVATPERVTIEDPYMRYTSDVSYTNRVLTLDYHFQTLADAVPAEGTAEHIEKRRRIQDDLSYVLTYATPAEKLAFHLNWPLLGSIVMLALLALGVATFIFLHHPRGGGRPPPLPGDGPRGLGGWLVLVGFGLFARVPILLLQLWKTRYCFNANHWRLLTDPGSETYHSLWAPTLMQSLHAGTVFLVWTLLLIVLFFKRRRLFPKLMIGLLAAECVGCGAELVFTRQLPGISPAEIATIAYTLFRSILILGVWGTYLLVSRRVRNTFRNG